jgi:hypothetical protein
MEVSGGQLVVSGAGLLVIIGFLIKLALADRDKRITKNESDIDEIVKSMATKNDLQNHKDSLRQDMSEMKGDIKLILSHILGSKNEK